MHWAEQNQQAEEALANASFITASGFARANCPFCTRDRKQCLSINVRTGWYKCWKCATKGHIKGAAEKVDTPALEQTQNIKPPEGYLVLTEEPAVSALSAEDARKYLRSRGLDAEHVWAEAHIGCVLTGRWANRVVVPVVSPAGEWWGWVSRLWGKGASDPYRTAPGMTLAHGVFNHAALLEETDDPVMVMEGCFDALPYWPNAVACLGKPKVQQVESLLEAKRPVAVCLDGDAWQEGEWLARRLKFEGQRAGFVRLPPKQDPNSVDPGWLQEEARRCLT